MTTLTCPPRDALADVGKNDGAQKAPAVERHPRPVAEIKAALNSAGYPALGGIHVSLSNDHILLAGVVPSFFMKQIAQEIALRTGRGADVCNALQVADARALDATCRANDPQKSRKMAPEALNKIRNSPGDYTASGRGFRPFYT